MLKRLTPVLLKGFPGFCLVPFFNQCLILLGYSALPDNVSPTGCACFQGLSSSMKAAEIQFLLFRLVVELSPKVGIMASLARWWLDMELFASGRVLKFSSWKSKLRLRALLRQPDRRRRFLFDNCLSDN